MIVSLAEVNLMHFILLVNGFGIYLFVYLFIVFMWELTVDAIRIILLSIN